MIICLICITHQLLLHNEIQEDKMDRASDIYVSAEECVYGFGGETWRNRPFGRPRKKWEMVCYIT